MATVAQTADGLSITLQLPPGYTNNAQAAIYNGTCDATGKAKASGAAAFTLKPAVSGSSQTTLSKTTLESLTGSPHILVVRGTPSLCGDLTTLLPPQKP